MKIPTLIKLGLVGTTLMLIPRRSSRQVDFPTEPNRSKNQSIADDTKR